MSLSQAIAVLPDASRVETNRGETNRGDRAEPRRIADSRRNGKAASEPVRTDLVHVEDFHPERDAATLRALAAWAIRFAPTVAPDEPDGLLLDVTGCERLYGSEARMLAKLGSAFAQLGFRPRIAVAPTFGCAWAVARYGDAPLAVVEAGEVRERIASLPVAALRLDDETVAALAEVGVDEIAHLYALPRKDLASRFGLDLLMRLDQALGAALEVLTPVRPQDPPRVDLRLTGPTTRHEAIEACVRSLLEQMAEKLEDLGVGGTRFELRFERVDCAPIAVTLALGRPSRDAAHLWSLLRPKVEAAHLGFGVEAMTFIAVQVSALSAKQRVTPQSGELDERLGEQRALGQLLDTLASRIGWNRVRRFDEVESHWPERAFRSASLLEASKGETKQAANESKKQAKKKVTEETASEHTPCAQRPTVLFDRPDPVERIDIDPTGAPTWMRWRGIEYEFVGSHGPERIASEWWRASTAMPRDFTTRDYYRVQEASGQWLWMFCEGGDDDRLGSWFVHGEWR